MTRKLAAILVADVVGYSRLAGADEDRILAPSNAAAASSPSETPRTLTAALKGCARRDLWSRMSVAPDRNCGSDR
ncbi:hypothetical protein EOS93_25425 [Rhizobium sp. RMa-01]|nr:hypothetical protein EOS93_25425 [Rhizobium sp. RMa-01]